MENELISLASSQGIWCVLCIMLLIYVLKAQEKRDAKQEEREKNFQNLIFKLTDSLKTIEEIKADLLDLKNKILNKE